ncbi:MAG: response regulator [Opitutaceae bacterium]|nr:response regulator [Opitutaceae bacterium]
MNNLPTIILVDDDEGHLILIHDNLEGAGVINSIVPFRNGQEFFDFLAELPPRAPRSFVFLLDLRMPKMDGVEMLRRLKADPSLKKMPVIMLTTADDSREIERCHELGCSLFLQKPVNPEQFNESIRRLGWFLPLMMVPTVTAA